LHNLFEKTYGKPVKFNIGKTNFNNLTFKNKYSYTTIVGNIFEIGQKINGKVAIVNPANTDGLGALRILEGIKRSNTKIKFYQASTSELFGGQQKEAYNENSPLNPRSPYAAAKAYAYYITKQYREAYGLFACNGILFNHESPRRGENFVSQKIIEGISKVISGKINFIVLGNLNARRDWGHAKDYVESMWMILNYQVPEDWVVSTGETFSVRDFCKIAFYEAGIDIDFKGQGVDEIGFVENVRRDCNIKIGQNILKVDSRFYRPLEVDHLLGDSTKARTKLGWAPKYDITTLVKEMLNAKNIC
jgi:GDPmannose 4,6-dehydratase